MYKFTNQEMSIQGRDKEILCDRLICNHKLKYLTSKRKKTHLISTDFGGKKTNQTEVV